MISLNREEMKNYWMNKVEDNNAIKGVDGEEYVGRTPNCRID